MSENETQCYYQFIYEGEEKSVIGTGKKEWQRYREVEEAKQGNGFTGLVSKVCQSKTIEFRGARVL